MKKLLLILLSVFTLTACQQDDVEAPVNNVQSRAVDPVFGADWSKVGYDLGYQLVDMQYVNGERGGMDAEYLMHSSGKMVMEVTLRNLNNYTASCSWRDFYLTENRGISLYHKSVKIYPKNSYMNNAPLETVTLEKGESQTLYFYTEELFKVDDDSYSYSTTPPFIISLHYKDKVLTSDELNVQYDSYPHWEQIR